MFLDVDQSDENTGSGGSSLTIIIITIIVAVVVIGFIIIIIIIVSNTFDITMYCKCYLLLMCYVIQIFIFRCKFRKKDRG